MDIGNVLSVLLGLPHDPATTAPDATAAPPATVAAPAPVNPQPIPAPASAPETEQSAPSPQDITVTGDRWKPKHTSVLGTIADVVLGAPVFHEQTKKDNLVSAMQGFADNPLQSIRRVAQINPNAAWQMYNTYHDNNLQDKELQLKEDDTTLGRIDGLLSVATPQNYATLKPRIEAYAKSRNYDMDSMSLPDTYDPAEIQAFRTGSLDAKSQLNQESINRYRQSRLNDFQEQIMQNGAYRNARLGQIGQTISNTQSYRQQRVQQIQSGLTEQQRHNLAIEGHTMPTPGTRELSPDRTVMREFRSDGQWHIFKKVNGKIQEVGVLAPQRESGTKYKPEDYADTPVDDGEEDQ